MTRKDDASWLASIRDWAAQEKYISGHPDSNVELRPLAPIPGLSMKRDATAPFVTNKKSNSSELDFRFLDLFNERSVIDCVEGIDRGRFSLTLLMGCSGCGKTSTLFSIASTRYCVVFFGGQANMMEDFREAVARSRSATNEAHIEQLFISLILARIVQLFVYYAALRISPQTWLLMQLCRTPASVFDDTQAFDFFAGLTLQQQRMLLDVLLIRFKSIFGTNFYVAVDEVQVLMEIVVNVSEGQRGGIISRRLPRIWMNLPLKYKIRLVFSGTGLNNNIFLQAAISSAAKTVREVGFSFRVVSSFRYFSEQDVVDALSKYFEVDEEMRRASQVLVGRARFTYSFLDYLLSGRYHVARGTAAPLQPGQPSRGSDAALAIGHQEREPDEVAEVIFRERGGENEKSPSGLTLNREIVRTNATYASVVQLLHAREDEYKSPLVKGLKVYLECLILDAPLYHEAVGLQKSLFAFLRELVLPPSGGSALMAKERLRMFRELLTNSQTYSKNSPSSGSREPGKLLNEDNSAAVVWYLSGACFVHYVSEAGEKMTLSFSEPLVIAAAVRLFSSANPSLMVQSLSQEWIAKLGSLGAGNTSSGCALQDILPWKLVAESWRNMFHGRSYCLRDALTSLCGNHFGKPQWLTDDLLDAPLRPSHFLIDRDDEMLRRLSEERSAQLEVFLPSPMARPDGVFRFGDVLVTFACKQRARFTLKDFCDNVMSSDPRLAFLQNPISDARRLKRFLDKAAHHSSMCVAGASGGPFPEELPPPSDRESRERWLQILPK
jgi:hypothetical protein